MKTCHVLLVTGIWQASALCHHSALGILHVRIWRQETFCDIVLSDLFVLIKKTQLKQWIDGVHSLFWKTIVTGTFDSLYSELCGFLCCLFDPVFMVLSCFISCFVGLGRAQAPKELLSCIYIFIVCQFSFLDLILLMKLLSGIWVGYLRFPSLVLVWPSTI